MERHTAHLPLSSTSPMPCDSQADTHPHMQTKKRRPQRGFNLPRRGCPQRPVCVWQLPGTRPLPAAPAALLPRLRAPGALGSLFTSLSIPQGSWRSSRERRHSPSRREAPRRTRSRSRDRLQVSLGSALEAQTPGLGGQAAGGLEAAERPWAWAPERFG